MVHNEWFPATADVMPNPGVSLSFVRRQVCRTWKRECIAHGARWHDENPPWCQSAPALLAVSRLCRHWTVPRSPTHRTQPRTLRHEIMQSQFCALPPAPIIKPFREEARGDDGLLHFCPQAWLASSCSQARAHLVALGRH